jgi:tRNA dimethylallyltransferase
LDGDARDDDLDRLASLSEEGVIVTIVGPTASGKTDLATRLAARIGGEVISADSVQVYRRFDLGSGKPTREELGRAPHHLVDVVDPGDAIDAARYAELATRAIEDIRARGKKPIVCGGTFLWVKALLFGLADAPPADPAIRARHHAIAEEKGRGELHRLLASVDPRSAERLHPNDVVRVGRALEVFELTGETLSALHERHAFRTTRHLARLVARRVTPEDLTVRIARRVTGWLEAGWIAEVGTLLEEGYGETRAMGSVGYREVRAHLAGELSREALGDTIVRATRVFARRQRTWLGHADVMWIE